MGRLSRLAVLAGVAALVAAPGCGGGGETEGDGTQARSRSEATATATTPSASRKSENAPAQTVTPSHCPPGHPACRSTEGRIVYVERVDPDAHFVIVDPQSITLPELTAIDVRKGLRPHPLPGPGDLISAAGPVQTGSHGQYQIHALELHVAGR